MRLEVCPHSLMWSRPAVVRPDIWTSGFYCSASPDAQDFKNQDYLLDLIGHCSSFVTVRNGNIYFIHQSAKDFLTASRSKILFSNGIHEEHGLLIGCSMKVMSETLHHVMCKLKHFGAQVQVDKIDDRLKTISYICCFWVDHLSKYYDTDVVDSLLSKEYVVYEGSVHHFLIEHLLHWFEALSALVWAVSEEAPSLCSEK